MKQVYVEDELHQMLKEEAIKNKVKLQKLINDIIMEHFKEVKDNYEQ